MGKHLDIKHQIINSSAFQPAFSWRHFFVQTLVVGHSERLGSLAERAERLSKHRNIHHLESSSETRRKMFQMYSLKICHKHCVHVKWRNRNPLSKAAHAQIQPNRNNTSKPVFLSTTTTIQQSYLNLKAKSILRFSAYLANIYLIVSRFWVFVW